jgi:hypothetical protein
MACTTLINSSEYHSKLRNDFKLLPPVKSLANYDDTPIKNVEGMIVANVRVADREGQVEIYVVPDGMSPTIGNNTIRALGLILDGKSGKIHKIDSNFGSIDFA